MFRKLFAGAAILGTLSLAACDVEGAITDLQNDLVDAAFQTIRDDAQANGGDALMLHAGTAATLTVKNPASPINGATITVPADALPADAANVAITIQTPPAGLPSLSPDDLKINGPLAAVVLVALPDGAEVKLVKPINIALPYAAGDTYPADKLVLGNVPKTASDGIPTKVEGSSSDAAKKQVKGDVLEPNLLMALYPVTWDGVAAASANTLVYKVLAADGTTEVCVGLIDLLAQKVVSQSRESSAAGDLVTLGFAGVGSTLSLVNNTNVDAVVAPPTTNTVDVVAAASELTFTCKGVTYAGTQNLAATFSFTNFVGDAVNNPHVGTIDLTAAIDVKTQTGERVLGKIGTTTLPNFSWAE
jgi:hypothetical protein